MILAIGSKISLIFCYTSQHNLHNIYLEEVLSAEEGRVVLLEVLDKVVQDEEGSWRTKLVNRLFFIFLFYLNLFIH